MSPYATTALQLFGGNIAGILLGIILPGYAVLTVLKRLCARYANVPTVVAFEACISTQGFDSFTFSILTGMMSSALLAISMSRSGVNLAVVGVPVFGAYLLLSIAIIALLRPRTKTRELTSSKKQSVKGERFKNTGPSLESLPNQNEVPQTTATRAIRIICRAAGLLLIALYILQLCAYFYGSPYLWDVPLLGAYQQAFWGDYPAVQMRGGWLQPALIMVSAIFEPAHFPMLNSGLGPGWLSLLIVFVGLAYLAPRNYRILWMGCVALLLMGGRFSVFMITSKFSVLGVALYLIFLGCATKYLDENKLSSAFLASFAVGLGLVAGLVGPFYIACSLVFLLPLYRLRLVPIIVGAGVWCLILVLGSAIHWTAGLVAMPVAFVLSGIAVAWSVRYTPAAIPSVDGASAAAGIVFAVVATLLVSFYLPTSDYPWYAPNKLLDLYVKGYGVFVIPAIFFVILIALKRSAAASDVVLLSTLFTSLFVPVADMTVANRIKLPQSVPGIIYYEIGRDTCLYVVPVSLALLGGAIIFRFCSSVLEKNLVLGISVLLLAVGVMLVPSPMYAQEGLGGWEDVAFTPMTRLWRILVWRIDRAERIASEAGPPGRLSFYYFGSTASEVQVARALADVTEPSSRCITFLMKGQAPTNDDDAAGFFAWRIPWHVFPYARLAPDAASIPNSPSCNGRRTLVVHKSGYDLLAGLQPTFQLKRQLPTYRVYSELNAH